MLNFDPIYLDTAQICRAIGLLGVTIYVISFFLLCAGRLDSSTTTYFSMNMLAAGCVMVSLMTEFNLSALLIQVFYLTMSLGGIALRFARGASRQKPAT